MLKVIHIIQNIKDNKYIKQRNINNNLKYCTMYNWRDDYEKQLLGTVLLSTFLLGACSLNIGTDDNQGEGKRIMKKVVNIVQVSLKTSRVIKIPR